MGQIVRWAAFLLALTSLAAPAAHAASCAIEAAIAERNWAIPAGLLAAIGRVESGRPEAGVVAAWPYSVNSAGIGHQYATVAEAIAQVRTWQADGVRSIDVGCFQVNLMYHPNAFASLEEAFDPAANAREAARFLHDLRSVSADWQEAAARYHSSNPPIGQPYGRTVMAVWGMPASAPAVPPGPPVPPKVLQTALDAAGIHLPTVVVRLPGQPVAPPTPARLVLAGRAQRG